MNDMNTDFYVDDGEDRTLDKLIHALSKKRHGDLSQYIELSENDTGAMICFRIPEIIKPEIVAMYPGIDKKLIDELHITLAFLGDSRTIDKKKVRSAIQSFALMQRPIKGRLQGQARFVGAGDTDVHVALYDSPDMPELYMRLLFCLDNAGVVYSREHGFIPHMTLAYIKKDDELKFETNKFLEINLDMAYCVHGSEWVPYFLIGGQ